MIHKSYVLKVHSDLAECDDEYQRGWAGAYGVAPPRGEGVCLLGRALGELRPLGSGVAAPRAEASRGGREGAVYTQPCDEVADTSPARRSLVGLVSVWRRPRAGLELAEAMPRWLGEAGW
jgi:hypothetical protein